MQDSSTSVQLWWYALSAVACLNLVLLLVSYRILKRRSAELTPLLVRLRHWQLRLSALYVLGCGFRSVVPRGDIRRIVLFDSWISSVAIGRSVATIAEIAFAAQWAWLLYEIHRHNGNPTLLTLSRVIVPIIVVAEIFSWYACLTTNWLGTVIEESLWAVTASLFLVGLALARPSYRGPQRAFITAAMAASVGYVIYMVTVDVPAYVSKWLRSDPSGFASVWQGFGEVARVRHVTWAYTDWQYEMVWMSLYFSVAVWMSLVLIHAPRMDRNLGPAESRPR